MFSDSNFQLVGAVVLLSHFKGSDSFTLDRNVVDADDSLEATTTDSLETSTDSRLDSMEHINQTSIEDNSLEARKVKRNVQPVVAVVGDYDYYQDSIESTTVDNVSLEDILEAGLNGQPQTTVAPNLIEASTPDDDLYDDLVNSTEDLLDTQNDTSLETNDDLNTKPVAAAAALPSLSVLNHLPVIGVFSHPASDDLYFVKQYLGDYYFWEMGDDYARNYFAQTAKDTTTFNFFETPIKVNAAQFTQFTPVRSLPAAF